MRLARSAANDRQASDTNSLPSKHRGSPATITIGAVMADPAPANWLLQLASQKSVLFPPESTRLATARVLKATKVYGKITAVHGALFTHWQPGVEVSMHRTCRFNVRQKLITGVKKALTGRA